MKMMLNKLLVLFTTLLMTTAVYAHPGHNHAELPLSELFVHMLAWGGLLAIFGAGSWLIMWVRNQHRRPRRVKVKK